MSDEAGEARFAMIDDMAAIIAAQQARIDALEKAALEVLEGVPMPTYYRQLLTGLLK